MSSYHYSYTRTEFYSHGRCHGAGHPPSRHPCPPTSGNPGVPPVTTPPVTNPPAINPPPPSRVPDNPPATTGGTPTVPPPATVPPPPSRVPDNPVVQATGGSVTVPVTQGPAGGAARVVDHIDRRPPPDLLAFSGRANRRSEFRGLAGAMQQAVRTDYTRNGEPGVRVHHVTKAKSGPVVAPPPSRVPDAAAPRMPVPTLAPVMRAVTSADNGSHIIIPRGDGVTITLPENPTTGWYWDFDRSVTRAVPPFNKVYTRDVAAPGKTGVGGTATYTWAASAAFAWAPAETVIRLVPTHVGDLATDPTRGFQVGISNLPRDI